MPSTLHELLVMLLRATVGTFLVTLLPLAWRALRWREANVMLPMPTGQERRVDLLLIDAAEPPMAGVVVEYGVGSDGGQRGPSRSGLIHQAAGSGATFGCGFGVRETWSTRAAPTVGCVTGLMNQAGTVGCVM